MLENFFNVTLSDSSPLYWSASTLPLPVLVVCLRGINVWSYSRFFCASRSISYASLTSINFWEDISFLLSITSGWYWKIVIMKFQYYSHPFDHVGTNVIKFPQNNITDINSIFFCKALALAIRQKPITTKVNKTNKTTKCVPSLRGCKKQFWFHLVLRSVKLLAFHKSFSTICIQDFSFSKLLRLSKCDKTSCVISNLKAGMISDLKYSWEGSIYILNSGRVCCMEQIWFGWRRL